MTVQDQGYDNIKDKLQTLASLISRQIAVSQALDMTEIETPLNELKTRVLTDKFKLLVIGEFSTGKSTFINALLQQKILPADPRPLTAIINEIKWGETPKAVLHYRQSKNSSVKPPEEIPVEKINEYVAVYYEEHQSKSKKNAQQQIHESPYEKLELFWPLELCQHGVELIDSPGLNANKTHQDITENYLSNVDAVLFVLSCLALASETEIKTINNTLIANGYEDIFFICNRIDGVDEEELDGLKRYGLDNLAPLSSGGEKYVFFISALAALKGYLNNDQERIEQSGIQQLEEALQYFLVTIKGRVKIIQPAKQLKVFIRKARETIPQREKMLQTPLEELKEREKASKTPLDQLQKTRQNIVQRVSNFREDVREIVKSKARRFYEDLAQKIESWIEEYEIQEPVKLFSGDVVKLGSAIERVVEEITHHLSEKIEDEFTDWQTTELQPFFSNRLEELLREIDEKAGKFLSQVEKARLDLIGASQSNPSVNADEVEHKISPLERILSAASGWLLMDFTSGAIGLTFGYKEMLKSLIPQLAIGVGVILVAGVNPWILIPALLSGGFVQGLIKVGATNEKIKKKVSEEYVKNMRESASDKSDEIAKTIATKISGLQEAINEGLGQEIQGLSNQVNSILKEKEEKEFDVRQKIQELESIEEELNALESDLDELITQVALL